MADLFDQMNDIFRHKIPEGKVNTWVMHRFFASDPSFAPPAKEIGNTVWDDELRVGIWAVAVPRMAKAPRFSYPSPKKKSYTDLVKKIAEVECLNMMEAEQSVILLSAMGQESAAMRYYGIETKGK